MGRILNGILGGVKGKIAGVVGANWRGINYLRGYAIPSNPRTVAQTEQRTRFAFAIKFAQSILSTIINPLWKYKRTQMTPYNAFLSTNIQKTDEVTGVNVSNLITQGSLEGTPPIEPGYDPTSGEIMLTWSATCVSNGLATDNVSIVVYDTVNEVAKVVTGTIIRSAATATIQWSVGRTATDLICFLGFYRGLDKNLIMSNSEALSCVEM